MDYSFLYKKNERFGNVIKDACEILLREAAAPLHVSELFKLLRQSDFKLKSDYSQLSLTGLLFHDRRFYKVAPGTFDLVSRDTIPDVS